MMKLNRKEVFDYISDRWIWMVIIAILLVLLLIIMGSSFLIILTVIFFILIGAFSTFYFNYITLPVNLELVKIGTILTASIIGIPAGLIVGILATLIGKILIGRIDEKLPISLALIALVAIAAGFVNPDNLVLWGVVLVLFYNILSTVLAMIVGTDLMWTVPYEGTNLFWNIFLFTAILPIFMQF